MENSSSWIEEDAEGSVGFWPNITNTTFTDEETNRTMSYMPYNQRPETYIMPMLFSVIFIVGVVGNVTLICIILLNRKLRNAPNIYIVSLAIGDLLVVSLSMPIVSSIYIVESWPFGVVFCKCCLFVRNLSVGVTVFTLAALSFDRYWAIVTPFKRASQDSWQSTAYRAILIWCISILLSLPDAYTGTVEAFFVNDKNTLYVCKPFTTNMLKNYNVYVKMNVLCKFLIFYLLPLLLITFVHVMIAKSLLRSVNELPVSTADHRKSVSSRKKVAKIVLCFVIIFAICFLPNHIFMLWFYFNPNSYDEYNDFWNILRMVGFTLCFANSCVNPIALYCISKDFRQYYNRYLFQCCRNVKRRDNASKGADQKCVTDSIGLTDTIMLTPTNNLDRKMNDVNL